jgi:hypothetical protein
VNEGSPVDEGANQHAVICLTKRRSPTVTTEQLQADLEKAKADLKTTQEELAKALAKTAPKPTTVGNPAPTTEEVEKALPESVREELRKAREERATLAKALEAEVEKRENSEWIGKAKAYGAVADASELGPVLRKAARSLSEADMAVLDKVLKSAGAIAGQVAKLTKAAGVAGAHAENSAEARIEKRVGDLRKASPSLTYEQAYTKALDEDPTLYAALNGQEA